MKIKVRNPESFTDLTSEFQKYIDDDETGGILCAVYKKGNLVYSNKFGWKDKEDKIPIAFDDIFRLHSMTKPITCLAALILHEEGKYELNDPLEKYLPEFKNLKILKSYDHETGEIELEDIKNPITIKQLFTHTSGLSYGFYPSIPVDMLYGKKFGFTSENRIKSVLEEHQRIGTLENFGKRLASLPLISEPESCFWYAFGHDVLGLLIEKLSGKAFDVFLKERIFDKIGMKDTDFYVPLEEQNRLVEVYTKDQENNLIKITDSVAEGYNHKPIFLSGGAGLASTLEDYLKFCIMMLNGGQYDGNKVISKKTIDLMASNQLPDGKSYLEMQLFQPEDPEIIKRNEGFGFGLGVIVKTAENMHKCAIGEYGWDGALNVLFRIDPANQLITVVMTQYCPVDNNWILPIDIFRITDLVYDALEKT